MPSLLHQRCEVLDTDLGWLFTKYVGDQRVSFWLRCLSWNMARAA